MILFEDQRIIENDRDHVEGSSSSSSSSSSSVDATHEYAQKLNNISAMYIEIGKYDKAISSLGKALKLLNHVSDIEAEEAAYTGRDDASVVVSIDGCIAYSEKYSTNIMDFFDISRKASSKNGKKSKSKKEGSNTKRKSKGIAMGKEEVMAEEEETSSSSKLYQKPIRIPKVCIHDTRKMGFTTLFCVITFNLALSHHLKASLQEKQTTKKNTNPSHNHNRTSLIHSAAQLYELAGNSILSSCDEDRNGRSSSISASTFQRFNTILCNNLNHLNRMISSSNENTTRRSTGKRGGRQKAMSVGCDLLATSFADISNDATTVISLNPIIEDGDEEERLTSPKRLSPSSPGSLYRHDGRLRSSFGSISYDDHDLEFEYYSTKDLQDDDRARQFFNKHKHHHHQAQNVTGVATEDRQTVPIPSSKPKKRHQQQSRHRSSSTKTSKQQRDCENKKNDGVTTTMIPMKDAASGSGTKSQKKATNEKTPTKASSLSSSPPPPSSSTLRSVIRRVTSKENLLGLITGNIPGVSSSEDRNHQPKSAATAWSKENAENSSSSLTSLLSSSPSIGVDTASSNAAMYYSSSSSSFRSSIIGSCLGSKNMNSSNSTLSRISSTENLLRRVTSADNLLGMF